MTSGRAVSGRGRIHMLVRRLVHGLEQLRGDRPLESPDGLAPPNRVAVAFQVVESYERLSGEVYGLRAKNEGRPGLREADELLAETASNLLRTAQPESDEASAYFQFISLYRRLWRKHLGLFYFTTSIFLAACLLGWNIGVHQPDYVTLIAGQGMMETIYDHKPWFESIQGNSAFEGARIAANNIRVSLTCFALGALFGVGSLVILGFNGLSFGCIFGYCYKNGFHEPLLGFVLSHGPLELTIVIASCFAGLLMGRAFFVRPLSLLRPRLALAAKEAACVCVGVMPWLCIAGFFEGFISPYHTFSFGVKMAMGLFIAGLFWFWTFSPVPTRVHAKREARNKP